MLGLKIRETSNAITKRSLDDCRRRQFVPKGQDFELIAVDAERKPALAEPILEEGRTGRGNMGNQGIHE
jgi:hypothetical protein